MKRALFPWLAMALALPGASIAAQDAQAPGSSSLAVRFHAILSSEAFAPGLQGRSSAAETRQGGMEKSPGAAPTEAAKPEQQHQEAVVWQEESLKYTVLGVPAGIRLVGSNIVVLFQITPFAKPDSGLNLVAQGQVWVKDPRGGISYRTTMDTVSVEYGQTVFFYPLGTGSDGKAPLRLEINITPQTGSQAAPQVGQSGQ